MELKVGTCTVFQFPENFENVLILGDVGGQTRDSSPPLHGGDISKNYDDRNFIWVQFMQLWVIGLANFIIRPDHSCHILAAFKSGASLAVARIRGVWGCAQAERHFLLANAQNIGKDFGVG